MNEDAIAKFKEYQRQGWKYFAPLEALTTPVAARLVKFARVRASQSRYCRCKSEWSQWPGSVTFSRDCTMNMPDFTHYSTILCPYLALSLFTRLVSVLVSATASNCLG